MKKGAIVLVPFPFTDLSGSRKRPAVVLIDSAEDVTICFITTQLKWKTNLDVVLAPSKRNGLKKQSLIRTSKIATIDKGLVIGLLGYLDNPDLVQLNERLLEVLQLKGTAKP